MKPARRQTTPRTPETSEGNQPQRRDASTYAFPALPVVPTCVKGIPTFRNSAFLDRQQRQMEVALSLLGGGGQHTGYRGIDALQRCEAEFRRGIGMLEQVDQLLGRPFVHIVPPCL